MTEESPGNYVATIPELYPLSGNARIEITVVCPDTSETMVDFDIYIDPSGIVREVSGVPLTGAMVTLSRSDSSAGPFLQVTDGNSLMSPVNRRNPDLTDDGGRFGWDVIAGFYIASREVE